MATAPSKYVKQIQLGSDSYEIAAGYILNGTEFKDWSDIESLVTAGFTIVAPWTKDNYESATAPTAEKLATVPAVTIYYNNGQSSTTGTLAASVAETKKHIYLIYHPHDSGADKFDEYVSNTDNTWEKIGNSDVDLSNYVQKGTYAGTAAEAGAHTHSVTGTTAVPTISNTDKKLGITRSTDVALDTSSKSTVATGVKVSATDNVLGEATTFTTTVTPATKKISATAAGTAVSSTKDEVLGSGTNFTVTGGELTGATAASKEADSWTANVPTTPAVIDTTKFNGGAAATFTQGAKASFTQGAFTQGTLPSYEQGSKAEWSATVNSSGVLSFSFTANGDDTWSAGTLPTHAADSFTANGTDEFNGGSAASLGTGFYTAGTKGSAATFVEGEFTPNTVGSVSTISVAADDSDRVEALKSVSVSAQPTITIAAGDTGDVTVATGITSATTSASGDVVAAATAVAVDGTADALTAVSVSTQPVFALDNTAATGIAYVQDITVGSKDVALANGTAASDGAHAHTTSVTL